MSSGRGGGCDGGLQYTRDQYDAELKLILDRTAVDSDQRNGDDEQDQVADETDDRVGQVYDAPIDAGVAAGRVLGLPRVRPQSSDGCAVENYEEQLRNEAGCNEAKGDVDGKRENAMPQAEPAVEAQAGHAAGVESGSVDDVRGEVKDFGCVNGG